MIGALARKTLQTASALLATSFLVFIAVYLIGEPTALYDPLIREDPERLAALRERLGLNLPLHEQYLRFLANLLQGDFGESWVYQEPAVMVILERLPATLELVFIAMVLAVVLGYPLGLLAGLSRNNSYAAFIERAAIFGYSTPTFWIGLVLIYVFGVWGNILPTIGRGESITILGGEWSLVTLDGLSHLILPAVTLALYEIGYVTRMVSTMTQETTPKDFIRFARAKGLPQKRIVSNHIIKNTSIPLITIIAIETGALIAGSVITETVFGWPGIGKLLVDSVAALDRPVIVAFIMLTVCFFLILNLVADLLYTIVDPRLRQPAGGTA
ncbi:MAG: ABC transporter permease [Pseudomonadota bacterium]